MVIKSPNTVLDEVPCEWFSNDRPGDTKVVSGVVVCRLSGLNGTFMSPKPLFGPLLSHLRQHSKTTLQTTLQTTPVSIGTGPSGLISGPFHIFILRAV